GLTRMHTLNVRENPQLTALPANVFADTPNLELLSLSENAIAALPATVFSRLGKLKSLWLHGNALTTLPVDVFAGKNKLTTLTLRGNPLASFPVGAFNGLTPGVTQVDGFVQPAPPSGLQLAPSGAGGLRAAWDEVSGAHYQVRWKPLGADAFAPGDAHASSGASYTITGLATGATYEVHVASVPGTPTAGSVFAVWASSVARGGPPAAPGAPQSVQVRAENPRELSVSWAAPASDGGDPVVTYRLRWKAAEAAAYAPADRAAVNADTLAYAISGLADGGAYEVQVAAENAAIVGAYSAAVRGTVFALPDPPRDVLVTSKAARRLTVAWKQPAADGGTPVTSYHLRWKPLAEAAYAP
ncbi:MAG: fibronectin type III domain-containing protein, partial [Gammaproteobacteria bacterium]|nr:fibronectin type III domain-containing protein [Gammaproteobacteria bacterium]